MARVRRRESPDDDPVQAAESVLPDILMFYRRFREKRPVMLLDLQSRKIYAYPYEEFKADLGQRSQATLTADYEKAIAMNKVVVFVRDKNYFNESSAKFFHVRSVRPGVKTADSTEIIAGLFPGEVIACKNSVVLQSQLLKSNLGAGCGCADGH